jgi:hypothetical protein
MSVGKLRLPVSVRLWKVANPWKEYSHLSNEYRDLFILYEKNLERETDQSPSFSPEVKNAWRYISIRLRDVLLN